MVVRQAEWQAVAVSDDVATALWGPKKFEKGTPKKLVDRFCFQK